MQQTLFSSELSITQKDYNWFLKIKSLLIPYYSIFALLAYSIFIPASLSFLFGISAKHFIQYIFYALIYHGLNGFLLLSILKQDFSPNLRIPAILVSGICYNIISIFFLSFFHLQKYSFLNVLFLLVVNYTIKPTFIRIDATIKKNTLKKSIYKTLFIIPLFITGTGLILKFNAEQHFLVQGAIASFIAHTPYPYVSHLFPEIPYWYNYAYHLEMAFCSFVTSISFEEMSFRIYPLYTLFLLMNITYYFCVDFLKGKEITGLFLIVNTFCIISCLGPCGWSLEWVLFTNPIGWVLVGSSTLGLIIFFLAIIKAYEVFDKKYLSFPDLFFLFIILFVGAISRSSVSVVLGGGFGLLTVTEFFKNRKILPIKHLLIIDILVGITFVLSLFLVYGFFSSGSAVGFLKVVPQNLDFGASTLLKKWLDTLIPAPYGNYYYLNYRIATLIYLLISPGYLIFGFYYQISKWMKEGINKLELLLGYCALSGAIVWNFTNAGGGSHFTFVHYLGIIVGMFGAMGTYLIYKDALAMKSKFLLVLAGLSTIMLGIKGYEVISTLSIHGKVENLSFERRPYYSDFSENFLGTLKSLTAQKENTILISLASQTVSDLKNTHVLTMNSAVPVYSSGGLGYLVPGFHVISERVEAIKKAIKIGTQEKILSDDTLNMFKILFPQKDIIFIVNSDKNVQSQRLHLLEEVDNLRLLQYSSF